jgi:SAM-dependent methyltransferase
VNRSDYTEANRRGWNQAAAVHRAARFERWLADFRRPGFSSLDAVATDLLTDVLNVRGKNVAHVCCNNGRELLSVKNLGAGRCVGFDIAGEFIAQALELAQAAGLDAEFVTSDVYAIPSNYFGQFDILLVTIGALGWLPDLDGAMRVVRRLLRLGAALFIYEQHPILNMFEGADRSDPPPIRYSYFRAEPFVESDGLDYFTFQPYDSHPLYWFPHKMCDVITACVANGLTVEHFREYDHDISNVFAHLAQMQHRPPLCYTLIARKQDGPDEDLHPDADLW